MSNTPAYEELQQELLALKKELFRRERIEHLLEGEIVRWRTLVEESRDGIVILNQQYGVLEANSSFADMLGYTSAEVQQLHIWDWDAHHDKAAIMTMVDTVDTHEAHFERRHRRKNGTVIDVEISTNGMPYHGGNLIVCVCRDVTERNREAEGKAQLVAQLQQALSEIQDLKSILPICAICKKIRVDEGSWEQLDTYVREHLDAKFSHGLCPKCTQVHYPEMSFEGT